ncbi:MAG: histidine kinase [Bacteroidales bacterium]|nr:histidine kinase [Bacteroidales bacterium]
MRSPFWPQLLFLFLLISTCLNAQHPGYRLYTVSDGLAQSEVMVIHQDKKGFLWIGTKNGISRFDGHAFQTITDSGQVARSQVRFIDNLDDSAVLIVTNRGYVLYEYLKLNKRVTSGKIPDNLVGFWIKDGKGEIVVKNDSTTMLFEADRGGLRKIDHSYLDILRDKFLPGLWGSFVYAPASRNIYFQGSSGNLCCLRGDRLVELPGTAFSVMTTGKDGHLYILTPERLNHTITENGRIMYQHEHSTKIPQQVRLFRIADTLLTLVHDFGGEQKISNCVFYITDQDNFLTLDNSKQSVTIYENKRHTTYPYDIPITAAVLRDREDNLWLGSALGLIRTLPLCFSNYTDQEGLFPDNQSVAEDMLGNIVTGGSGQGIQVLKDGKFIRYPFPKISDQHSRTYIYPGGRRDHKGIVHFCVNPYCTVLWDGARLYFPTDVPKTTSLYFFEDQQNHTQYYGVDYGLLIKPEGSAFSLLTTSPGNKTNKIVSIEKDGRGRLILGGFRGVSFLEGEKVMHLPTADLPYDQGANAMVRDGRDNVWIGNTDGLYLFDNKQFKKVDNPWFNDLVVSLCLIDTSTLFIGGLRGIGLMDLDRFYDKDTAVIRYFDRDNGFLGQECQQNAVTMDGRGLLWFATTNTLVSLDPVRIPYSNCGPQIYITGVSVISVTMQQTPLISTDIDSGYLELNHQQSNLRFDFAGLCFRSPRNVRYRYMLDGHEHGWCAPTVERFAVYTNLKPGKYQFKVMAASDEGIWSETASVTIQIVPAFWQTWLFLAFLLCILAAFFFWSGYLVMNRRKKLLQLKLESEKKMAELQLISIRNQIDPHFTFNAMNSIASVILKEEKEKAYAFFVKFSNLIRQVLTSSDKVTRTLAEELVFVQNYLEIEKLRFRDSFQFTINIIQPVNLDQEVPKMVIHTYAENALKHGLLNKREGTGELTITLREEANKLYIVVEDNGIGREQAGKMPEKSTAKGLMILNYFYDFFDRYNDQKILHDVTDLFNEQNEPTGTKVTVVIPSGFRYHSG